MTYIRLWKCFGYSGSVFMSKICLGACLALYMGVCLFLIPVGTDDIRMLDVFSLDEANAVAVVAYLFRTGWELNTFSYGGLFFYIPLVVVKCLGFVGFEISHQLIAYVMRGICLFFGVGCVVLVYQLGRLVRGPWVGSIAAWLLVLNPIFLRWSVETHPDVPQLFWITCALWICVRAIVDRRTKWFWLAGLFAGLAFATKYAGVFLFPILGLATFWLYTDNEEGFVWPPKRWKQMAWTLGSVLLAFALAFLFTNPFAMINFDQFWSDISFESKHLSIGHVFRSGDTSVGWILDFGRLLGTGHFVVFLCTLVGMVCWQSAKRYHKILIFWIVLLLGYLVLFVNLRGGRYMLPILPAAVLIVSLGYQMLLDLVKKKWSGALGIVLLLIFSFQQAQGNWAFVLQRVTRATHQSEIIAGKWLAENFDSDTSVLYHSYGYVPIKFEQVFRSPNMDYLLVNHLQPDILVVRDASTREYEDPQNSTRAVDGPQAFWARHYFYLYLKKNMLEDYREVKKIGGSRVYERAQQKKLTEKNLSWLDRKALLLQKKYRGIPEAKVKLAVLHLAQGNEQLAKDALSQACASREGVGSVLEQTGLFLGQGRMDQAQRLLDTFFIAIEYFSPKQKAAMYVYVGRLFLEAGVYVNATQSFRNALRLEPDSKEGHFDLGLVDVVLGKLDGARKKYGYAVKQFGQDKQAADMLLQLVENNFQADVARAVLAEFF
jgi:4-amino-4-deoxy-L-arabinose transferase-like glycosyltransferase